LTESDDDRPLEAIRNLAVHPYGGNSRRALQSVLSRLGGPQRFGEYLARVWEKLSDNTRDWTGLTLQLLKLIGQFEAADESGRGGKDALSANVCCALQEFLHNVGGSDRFGELIAEHLVKANEAIAENPYGRREQARLLVGLLSEMDRTLDQDYETDLELDEDLIAAKMQEMYGDAHGLQ